MNLFRLLFVAFVCLACVPGKAEIFSASQARKAAAAAADLRLVYTHQVSSEPSAYVFSKGTNKGFVIMTAQGYEPFMLGYADKGDFDPADIPPALKEMLEAYSSEYTPSPHSRADKEPVDPLCSTEWDQYAPFNYFCPVHSGKKSVTGCGATAMAQIMKYYNYPSRGQGYNSYTYTYNGNEYTLSQDFSQAVIQWSAMRDTYGATYNGSESHKAVAELMKYCGIAINSTYSPTITTSYTKDILIGLIEYFNYDRGISLELREWYEDEAWENLIYNELANGRPMVYRGQTWNEDGHIFVCDGYAGDGYFHINWGWNGASDGFFLLSALNPNDKYDFKYQQMAGIGIKPNTGGECELSFYIGTELRTNAWTYNRASNDKVEFTGGFYSASLSTEDVEFGLKFSDKTNTWYTQLFDYDELKPNWGWTSVSASAQTFSQGEYDVYPVVRRKGETEWKTLKYNIAYRDFVHLIVTDSEITVSYPYQPMNTISVPTDDDAPITYYNLQGIPVANPQNGIYIKVQGTRRTKISL